MTKHIPLFIAGAALFSSLLVAADQPNSVKKEGSLAQLGSAASSEADPSFIPPPTTLISEPNQPQSAPASEARPVVARAIPAQVEQKSTPVPPVDLSATKTSPKEVARAVAQPLIESPLPQPLYEPNQNGVVVLPGRTRASSEEGVANPFDIRLIAFKPVNELKIRVGGVVMGGEKPTAIVNGQPYSANDRWSGFNVVQVRRDTLLLERDGVFVLIPRGRDISIKIPL